MCSLCNSEETLQEVKNEQNKITFLCEACRCCDECGEEIEEIDASNWKKILEFIRPSGWIFLDPSTFETNEVTMLYCGYCRDLFCNTCKSMTCKERCDECSAPCSEGCECKDPSEVCQEEKLM